ncbi:hypothetical protein FIBSPDRAFT_89725 [Athelia psychrophila]|uniref:Uncharacterized protein n=1 Tax=Athelia psychrophila TaxID=1759441 RepID=A0A166E008_9AGAM|nr:hypothetical protein FIBSPDRAFT_89725 [Fibularhizoctonia sp. CBS 109695]
MKALHSHHWRRGRCVRFLGSIIRAYKQPLRVILGCGGAGGAGGDDACAGTLQMPYDHRKVVHGGKEAEQHKEQHF